MRKGKSEISAFASKAMLSIEHIKELLNDQNISDKETEEIRDSFRMLAEIIFEKWQEEKQTKKRTKTLFTET